MRLRLGCILSPRNSIFVISIKFFISIMSNFKEKSLTLKGWFVNILGHKNENLGVTLQNINNAADSSYSTVQFTVFYHLHHVRTGVAGSTYGEQAVIYCIRTIQ